MKTPEQKKGNKIFPGLGLALAGALLLYLFLPVPYTLYIQPDDGGLRAADAITDKTPLQQCLDGNFQNVTGMDLLLATYARRTPTRTTLRFLRWKTAKNQFSSKMN